MSDLILILVISMALLINFRGLYLDARTPWLTVRDVVLLGVLRLFLTIAIFVGYGSLAILGEIVR